MEGKKIYFLSDAHLGASILPDNREREMKLIHFLESIRPDCEALFLLGDMFDFWFEYRKVVPKGSVRFLATLARFTDEGIPVHFFAGNHDIWTFDYLTEECGVIVYHEPKEMELQGKRFLIGHGDGLNLKDKHYLFLKKVFHNRFLQWCFRWIHPDIGIRLANSWSSHSRLKGAGNIEASPYRGDEQEGIVLYCKEQLKKQHYDYFIFGHRHLPIEVLLGEKSYYINTGDWITYFSYAVLENGEAKLQYIQ